MTNVEHFNKFLFLQDAVDNTIDMRFVTIEQVPELVTLARYRASIRLLLQAENGLLETPIPFQSQVRIFGVDFPVQVGKIALSAGSDVNALARLCHGGVRAVRTRRWLSDR